MKEMENNNFIHTLDAVYNLCSEIKVHIPKHTRSLSGSLLGYKTIP